MPQSVVMDGALEPTSALPDVDRQEEWNVVDDCANCSTDEPLYYGVDQFDFEAFERAVRIAIPIIFGVIAVLGFVGNLSVIVVVIANKTMRSTTNILIIGLAAADLVFIIVCVPFTATYYVLPNWPFGVVWCKIYQYLIHVTAHASVYTLVLMSFDRYLAVVHPIKSMTIRTVRNATIAVAASWTIICLANAPMLQVFEVVEYEHLGENRSTCANARIVVSGDMHHGQVFYGTFFAFAFVVPLTAVTLLYGGMVRRLLRNGVATTRNGKISESTRAKRRVTRMVIVVVVIFAVCWLPLQVIFVLQFFGNPDDDTPSYVVAKVVASCLAYMNSCVNPILYAFLSDNFRKGFWRLIACADGGFRPLRRTEMERTSVNARGALVSAGTERAVAAATAAASERDRRNGTLTTDI